MDPSHPSANPPAGSGPDQRPKQRRITAEIAVENRPLGAPIGGGRRRASQDSHGLSRPAPSIRQNSIRFRREDESWRDDSSRSGGESVISGLLEVEEVMGLRSIRHREDGVVSLHSSGSGSTFGSDRSVSSTPLARSKMARKGIGEAHFSKFFQVASQGKLSSVGSSDNMSSDDLGALTSSDDAAPPARKQLWLPSHWRVENRASVAEDDVPGYPSLVSLVLGAGAGGSAKKQKRRDSYHSSEGFSSSDSDPDPFNSGRSGSGSNSSRSSTSSKLWDRIEERSVAALSVMTNLADDRTASSGGRGRRAYSSRRCVRMFATVAMAVALATLVYFVSDENSSLPRDGGGFFERLFGDQDPNDKLRYRKLPQGDEGFGLHDLVPSGDDQEDVFHQEDKDPLPQESEWTIPDPPKTVHEEQPVPDPPRPEPSKPKVPKAVPEPTQVQGAPNPKVKVDKALSAHERNRMEHLERWKD